MENKQVEAEELDEVLSIAQRQKRSQIIRANKNKLKIARRVARGKHAPQKIIKKRAYALARKIIRRKFAGKRGADYANLSVSEKMVIDKAIESKTKLIKKLALRLIPRIQNMESKRLQSFMAGKKLENLGKKEMAESLNEKFAEIIGKKKEEKDKEKSVKVSSSPNIKFYRKFSEEKELETPTFLALKKKSDSSNIDIDILGEVYNRGCDCWKESYNYSMEQYAFARVNSFINMGKTYFKEDADLHEAQLARVGSPGASSRRWIDHVTKKRTELSQSRRKNAKKLEVVESSSRAESPAFKDAQKNLADLKAGKVKREYKPREQSLDQRIKSQNKAWAKEDHATAEHHRKAHNDLKKEHGESFKMEDDLDAGNHKKWGFSDEEARGAHEEIGYHNDKVRQKLQHHHNKFHKAVSGYEELSGKQYRGKLHEAVDPDYEKKLQAHVELSKKLIDKYGGIHQRTPKGNGFVHAAAFGKPDHVVLRNNHEDDRIVHIKHLKTEQDYMKKESMDEAWTEKDRFGKDVVNVKNPYGKGFSQQGVHIVNGKEVPSCVKNTNEEAEIDESNNTPHVRPHFGDVNNTEAQTGWKASNKHGKVKLFGMKFKDSANRHAGINESSSKFGAAWDPYTPDGPAYPKAAYSKTTGKLNKKSAAFKQHVKDHYPKHLHKQYGINEESIVEGDPNPAHREVGTDSATKIFANDTPGQCKHTKCGTPDCCGECKSVKEGSIEGIPVVHTNSSDTKRVKVKSASGKMVWRNVRSSRDIIK